MAALAIFDTVLPPQYIPSSHSPAHHHGAPWRSQFTGRSSTPVCMKPSGHFAIHHHPTIPDVGILCIPIRREIITLSFDHITQLYHMFRVELTPLNFTALSRASAQLPKYITRPQPRHRKTYGTRGRTSLGPYAKPLAQLRNYTPTTLINNETHTPFTPFTRKISLSPLVVVMPPSLDKD
jgi:hypothetical protein